MEASGSGSAGGMAVSDKCTVVGNTIEVAGAQAVKKTTKLKIRKDRQNMAR